MGSDYMEYLKDTKEIRQHWKQEERVQKLEAKGSNRTPTENTRLQEARAKVQDYHKKHGDNSC